MADSDLHEIQPPVNPAEHEPENPPREDTGTPRTDALSDENLKRLAEQVARFLADSNNDSAGGGKLNI